MGAWRAEGGRGGHWGSTGPCCGLSFVFHLLSPWSQFGLPGYAGGGCVAPSACLVIPPYLKQMETVARKQIDSSWNEEDLYPSACWCRNK